MKTLCEQEVVFQNGENGLSLDGIETSGTLLVTTEEGAKAWVILVGKVYGF